MDDQVAPTLGDRLARTGDHRGTESLASGRSAMGATPLGDPEHQNAVTEVVAAWLGCQAAAAERPGSVMFVVDNDSTTSR